MATKKDRVAWLISKRRQFHYSGSGMEPLADWKTEFNEETIQNNEIIDAVLAALEKLKITDEDRKVIASMAEEIGECDYTDTVRKIYEILELFGIKDNEPIKEESDGD